MGITRIYSKNRYLSFLHRMLFLWLKMKIIPRDFDEYRSNAGVCYVLSRKSFSDLLVLEQVCRRKNLRLPRVKPVYLPQTRGGGGYLFLHPHGRKKKSNAVLKRMIEALQADKSKEIKMIPVSVFWGRNPGRQESSWLRVFFSDAESLNPIKKLFIIMVQGRDILVNFGKPVSLQEFVREDANSDQLQRKLNRVLRVHFRTQKNAALGPHLYSRRHVIDFLMRSKNVVTAINSEAKKRGVAPARIERVARKNLETISSDLSPRFVLLFYIFLTWAFSKIFSAIKVYRSPSIAEVAQTQELIYLPCHRSHMDYLLLSYVLYREGLMVPHFGSGDNLNFWLIGTLLRKSGAFFLKRKFHGNRLYTTLFSEYMHYLVSKGYPMCFFLEGQRSRTGFLLEPKTGMLAMIAQSYLRDDYRKISLVPVYIGYDGVLEAKSFIDEIKGQAKKKSESFIDLIRARKVLKSPSGRAYVAFGEPIALSEFLQTKDQGKPFNAIISRLAHTVMEGIANYTVVTPLSLVATILLAKPQKSVTVNEFIGVSKILRSLSTQLTRVNKIRFPDLEPSSLLHMVEGMSQIKRFRHEGGDILYLENRSDPVLLYASNNVVAVFLIPALIAQFFRSVDRVKRTELLRTTCDYYQLMRREFFLPWNKDVEAVITETLDQMVAAGLLEQRSSVLSPPSIGNDNFLLLHNISCFMEKIFTRYAVLVTLLAGYHEHALLPRTKLEKQYKLLLRRITILKGEPNTDYEQKDKVVSYQIENFKKMELLIESEQQMLRVAPKLRGMARSSADFLEKDISRSIRRIAESYQGD